MEGVYLGKSTILLFAALHFAGFGILIDSTGKSTTMRRPLTYATFLAILSVNFHLCASSPRLLLAEAPPAIPNGQPAAPAQALVSPVAVPENIPASLPANIPANLPANMPANLPANMPANLPANLPTNLPANLPANMPANLPANKPANLPVNVPPELLAKLPPNVPPDVLASLPPETLANIEASQGQLQTSEILATLPAVQSQLPANLPPEVLAKLPEAQHHLPANITPEMVSAAAAMQQQPGQPGAPGNATAAGLPADMLAIPKMPDFSGLADISFPPMPSGPKMPQLPHDMSLFGVEVPIPQFITKMVDGDGGTANKTEGN